MLADIDEASSASFVDYETFGVEDIVEATKARAVLTSQLANATSATSSYVARVSAFSSTVGAWTTSTNYATMTGDSSAAQIVSGTHQVASAYLARGGALLADYDYGEAARDFRRAAELESNPDAKREAQEKQRNAEWRAKEWEKNPDREKILGLPANFGQLNQKSQCAWLKKSYKKMVLKWHPDKNKGNPERGRRKFEEVQTAKAAMAQQLGCKGRRRL